jgi:hypothetical protein
MIKRWNFKLDGDNTENKNKFLIVEFETQRRIAIATAFIRANMTDKFQNIILFSVGQSQINRYKKFLPNLIAVNLHDFQENTMNVVEKIIKRQEFLKNEGLESESKLLLVFENFGTFSYGNHLQRVSKLLNFSQRNEDTNISILITLQESLRPDVIERLPENFLKQTNILIMQIGMSMGDEVFQRSTNYCDHSSYSKLDIGRTEMSRSHGGSSMVFFLNVDETDKNVDKKDKKDENLIFYNCYPDSMVGDQKNILYNQCFMLRSIHFSNTFDYEFSSELSLRKRLSIEEKILSKKRERETATTSEEKKIETGIREEVAAKKTAERKNKKNNINLIVLSRGFLRNKSIQDNLIIEQKIPVEIVEIILSYDIGYYLAETQLDLLSTLIEKTEPK